MFEYTRYDRHSYLIRDMPVIEGSAVFDGLFLFAVLATEQILQEGDRRFMNHLDRYEEMIAWRDALSDARLHFLDSKASFPVDDAGGICYTNVIGSHGLHFKGG